MRLPRSTAPLPIGGVGLSLGVAFLVSLTLPPALRFITLPPAFLPVASRAAALLSYCSTCLGVGVKPSNFLPVFIYVATASSGFLGLSAIIPCRFLRASLALTVALKVSALSAASSFFSSAISFLDAVSLLTFFSRATLFLALSLIKPFPASPVLDPEPADGFLLMLLAPPA